MAPRTSRAHALARNPSVLLLDEAFGALDALVRLKMHDLLLEVRQVEPTTIVLVTHDLGEALFLAYRIVLLARSGVIVRIAPGKWSDHSLLLATIGISSLDRPVATTN